MVAVDAVSLAEQCRTSASLSLAKSEQLIAGAQVMVGVNDTTALNKSREAIFERGQANAYTAVAEALERLVAKRQPDAV